MVNIEKIKAIAVDDENHCLKTLEFELNRNCPEVELVKKINDADEAFEILKNADIDLLFLDIHLQSTSGIDLLERLLPVDFDVVFVTAYDEYAIKAFDLSAMHYLLKPVNGRKLRAAVEKVINKRKKKEREHLKEMIASLKDEINKSNKIPVPVHDGIAFIEPADIIYIQADSNYSTFFFKDGKKMTVSKTLKSLDAMLSNSGFLRIHKSHLINIDSLKKYVKNDGGYVILNNGTRLAVSRNKKQMLNQLFS